MLISATLMAHHSLANFDTTKAVRIQGKVLQFHAINPHSFIYLEGKNASGQVVRWAAEGPSVIQIKRRGLPVDFLKPGDSIEVCGYAPKENTMWQIANPDPTAISLSGRLLNAETLTTSDGKQQSWGDYGFHRCFDAGYQDQHNR